MPYQCTASGPMEKAIGDGVRSITAASVASNSGPPWCPPAAAAAPGRRPSRRRSGEQGQACADDQEEDAEGSLRDLRRQRRPDPGAEVGPDQEADRDDRRRLDVDVPRPVVLDRAEQADRQEERRQGRAGGCRNGESYDEDERRHDHEPAADPEQPRQDAADESDDGDRDDGWHGSRSSWRWSRAERGSWSIRIVDQYEPGSDALPSTGGGSKIRPITAGPTLRLSPSPRPGGSRGRGPPGPADARSDRRSTIARRAPCRHATSDPARGGRASGLSWHAGKVLFERSW